MKLLSNSLVQVLKLILFWVLIFEFQRLTFSIHNWSKFSDIGWSEWLGAYVYSFRLDIATAGLLSILPLLFLLLRNAFNSVWWNRLFFGVLIVEVIAVTFIHAGEINAYPEWNHKLTSRVFMHLSNPDEVFRTADYGMTIWFVIYSTLELFFAFRIGKFLLSRKEIERKQNKWISGVLVLVQFCFYAPIFLVLGRGGAQQIPINIDAAYYSKNYVANDLSVNSTYFFAKSFLLYNRSEIDEFIPDIDSATAHKVLSDFYNYPKEHDVSILENKRPNIVFVILESWSGSAISSITGEKGATPYFDQLAKEGLLFTNIYSTGSTSEIGNASIFSGYPALPEISISMQPDKHRKLPSLNEDLEKWGYSSGYMFSGDLKYGNIGGYFTDHGFDVVKDELDFPDTLGRGKLNYYDEDLYRIFEDEINHAKEPFLQCAFTGSTHSPYDYPDSGTPKWKGEEAAFMSSLYYADKCLFDFLESCKKEPWYDNTLFVLIADHGHASPKATNPSETGFFRIPILLYGEPLKKDFRGAKIAKVGSQADITKTLLYQMDGDTDAYRWSKDLLNPKSPEFALHTIIRGYGWVSPKGGFTYHMELDNYLVNTMKKDDFDFERKRCEAFLAELYRDYKAL